MNKIIKIDLEVYTYQIDFAHHVSNIVYIQWMEIGRLKLFEEIGLSVVEAEKRNITPILANTKISYKKPIYFGDEVRLEVWISELAFASAIIEYRFYINGNTEAATGQQKGLFINLTTKKPHKLTQDERDLFKKFIS